MKLALLSPIKVSRSWIVLTVAVLVGCVAAYSARSYLSARVAAIEAQGRQGLRDVIVAKFDLPKGAALSSENLAIRQIPADYAHSIAATPDQFARLDGQRLGYPVRSGEMILWGLMESKRAPTFSARIDQGRRAVTVQVDEISSISGMVEPGDIIDIILTLDRDGRKVTLPLLQSVLVLATGQRAVDEPKAGERARYATVTLDTTPAQAQNLIAAREAGKLTALLRNPSDKEAIGRDGIDLSSLFAHHAAAPREAATRSIPVLYGGSRLPQADYTLHPPGVQPETPTTITGEERRVSP